MKFPIAITVLLSLNQDVGGLGDLDCFPDYGALLTDMDIDMNINVSSALDYLTGHSVFIQAIGTNLDYNVTKTEQRIQTKLQVLQNELENVANLKDCNIL